MREKRWYAVYVRSRSEKKVFKQLIEQGTDSYLPLLKTLRQWSDRKKMVELPLFSSYVFVNISPKQFDYVLNVQGIVKFVNFDDKPATIPEKQIESLRLLLFSGEKFEIGFDEFKLGEKVEVIAGPLKGFNGILADYKGKKRVLLRIETINQSLFVQIRPSYLKKG